MSVFSVQRIFIMSQPRSIYKVFKKQINLYNNNGRVKKT